MKKLDGSKPFSTRGHNPWGIVYVQDGLFFGRNEEQIIIPDEPKEPTVEELQKVIATLKEEIAELKKPKRRTRKSTTDDE